MGNWLTKLIKSPIFKPQNTDDFVRFLSSKTGKNIRRMPLSGQLDIYSDGFRYLDDSGKEIAHIAGTKYGGRVFVESSFMLPEFRSQGLGKQMYFDFNDRMFKTYGKTIASSPYQHMSTLEVSPGFFISPSSRLWNGLKKQKLAVFEGPHLNKSFIMAEPKIIKPYKLYRLGGKINIVY